MNNKEIENKCIVCKNKIEFPEATLIFRSKEKETLTIWEFCSGECLDSLARNVGEIMINVEKEVFGEINNPNQEEIDKNKLKGGPK